MDFLIFKNNYQRIFGSLKSSLKVGPPCFLGSQRKTNFYNEKQQQKTCCPLNSQIIFIARNTVGSEVGWLEIHSIKK